jgi:hypothetical protein
MSETKIPGRYLDPTDPKKLNCGHSIEHYVQLTENGSMCRECVERLGHEIIAELREPPAIETAFELASHLRAIIEHEIVPQSMREVFAGVDDDTVAHYAVTLRKTLAALTFVAELCERSLMNRIEQDGLNPTGNVTRRRFGDYVAEYKLEAPYPDKAEGFEAKLAELFDLCMERSLTEQYQKTVKHEPKVNRTQLKSLASNGGEIGRLCAALFVSKDPVPKLTIRAQVEMFPNAPGTAGESHAESMRRVESGE